MDRNLSGNDYCAEHKYLVETDLLPHQNLRRAPNSFLEPVAAEGSVQLLCLRLIMWLTRARLLPSPHLFDSDCFSLSSTFTGEPHPWVHPGSHEDAVLPILPRLAYRETLQQLLPQRHEGLSSQPGGSGY